MTCANLVGRSRLGLRNQKGGCLKALYHTTRRTIFKLVPTPCLANFAMNLLNIEYQRSLRYALYRPIQSSNNLFFALVDFFTMAFSPQWLRPEPELDASDGADGVPLDCALQVIQTLHGTEAQTPRLPLKQTARWPDRELRPVPERSRLGSWWN